MNTKYKVRDLVLLPKLALPSADPHFIEKVHDNRNVIITKNMAVTNIISIE